MGAWIIQQMLMPPAKVVQTKSSLSIYEPSVIDWPCLFQKKEIGNCRWADLVSLLDARSPYHFLAQHLPGK